MLVVEEHDVVAPPETGGRQRRSRHPVIVLLAAAMLGGAAAVWFSPSFRHQVVLSTTERAAPYDELYFVSPTAPANVPVGRATSLRFTVVNHEGRTFRYEVSEGVGSPAGAHFSQVSVAVPDGDAWSGSVSFTPTQPGSYEVVVGLNPDVQIHATVEAGR
jgi:hypothetical protein